MSTKKAMMGWTNTVIPEYLITNFNTDWNDGRAVCGMVDRIRPGLCPNHFALDKSHGLENCKLGMDLAEQHLDIPKVLSPEDMNNPEVDDLSLMTYLSYFCNPYNSLLLHWIRQKIPQRNIKNLSTDWNNGTNLGALSEACFPGVCPHWEAMDPANAIQNNEEMIGLIKERLGIDCPVSAVELADPKMDEIVVATYLHHFRNAKLRASPEQFSLSIPPLTGGCAVIQEPFTFEVQVMDPAAVGLSSEITVQAHGPKSDAAVSIKPKGDDQNLTASFVPMEAGSYDIIASYNGQNIQGSPFQLQVADPSKCQLLGDPPATLQVGVAEEVVVKTIGAGGGKLGCSIDTPGESASDVVSSTLDDKGGDTYGIKLEPKSLGKAKVLVTWAEHDIPHTPFTVNVCDASQCSFQGLAGDDDEEHIVGNPVTFTVNTEGAGEGQLEVKPRGTSAIYTPTITSNGPEHEVSFTPWEVGPHQVEMLWEGTQIPGSPAPLEIRAAPDINACSATGAGLKRAIAGQPNTFKILSPEKGLLEKNKLEVTVSSMDQEIPVDMADNDDSTYTVTYTPPTEGDYVASVKFYEKPIPGSPFKITVVPAADASKCRAYGPALHPNSLHIAGTPLDLFVDTKEAGTGELQVVVKGPDDSCPKVYQANEDGVFSLKFDVPDPGKYRAYIWWSQMPIPGSPFKVKVHPGPIAANVVAYGPGLEPTVRVGDKGEFTVETKNAGIGTLTVRVHGVKGKFKIEANPKSDSNPRTLLAHYAPQEAGDYIIAIRWSGVHVPNSPFHIHILDEEEERRKKKQQEKQKQEKAAEESGSEEEGEGNQKIKKGSEETDGSKGAGGIRKMTKEEVRAYQQQMMESGYAQPMNPAFIAAGGAVGMERRYRTNPSMMPGTFVPGGQVMEVTKTTVTKTTGTKKEKVEKKKKGKKF